MTFDYQTDRRLNALEAEIRRLQQTVLLHKREITILRFALKQAGISLVNYDDVMQAQTPSPERNIAPMRPIEELTDEAAALDETLNMEQIGNYLSQPRVRPEDVTLSPDEIARANQKRHSLTSLDPELRRQMQQPPQLGPILLVVVLIIAVIVILATRF